MFLLFFRRRSRATTSFPRQASSPVISISRRQCLVRRRLVSQLSNLTLPRSTSNSGVARSRRVLGAETTLELGYLGSHGVHLQRSHLINNAPPGPGAIGPRRPFRTLSFLPGMVLPEDIAVTNTTFPVSGINLLENSAQSWYQAGYVNVRRRFARGWTFLANYTYSKNLSDAPDFRSPMFESAAPQNNSNLINEKGPACDIRHRFALSAVYALPAWGRSGVRNLLTKDWRLAAIYQVQSGFPFTISVFGDTANAGTLLGENPIRANHTGLPVFGPGTRTADGGLTLPRLQRLPPSLSVT